MFLRTVPRPYVMLFDLSAVDERLRTHRDGLPASEFTVFYHLLSLERNCDIRIKVALSDSDLNIPTATNIWPNANWYEREAYDMFGINFEGHQCSVVSCCQPTGKVTRYVRNILHVRLNILRISKTKPKQDFEQEHLRFVPEDWGLKRGNADEDFMFLNLGPNHPSAHGAFRVILQLDGEEVNCVPDIGYHHRGVEKMAERQTWHSFIPYTDRVDYLGGCAQNMPYVLGVEQMAGITVPDRAQCIRVMMSELFRINNHLLFIGTAIQDAGGMTPVFYMFADRQKIYDAIEAITGYRMHPAWFRIGGTASNNWQHLIREILDWMPKRLKEYHTRKKTQYLWVVPVMLRNTMQNLHWLGV